MAAQTVEPTFNRIIKDFQHFLNIREDNHKYIDHLFMERLKFEAELIERLENQIEQLKSMTLKQCPNCGIKRPKRYHRSTQTPHYFTQRDEDPISQNVLPRSSVLLVSRNRNKNNLATNKTKVHYLKKETSEDDDEMSSVSTTVDVKLKRLNDRVDKVNDKTTDMLQRSYELEFNANQLRRQLDQMKIEDLI